MKFTKNIWLMMGWGLLLLNSMWVHANIATQSNEQRHESQLLLQFVMELEGIKNVLRRAKHYDEDSSSIRFDYVSLNRDIDLIKNGVMQFLAESQHLHNISPAFPLGDYQQN